MRAFFQSSAVVLLAGAVSLGSVSFAMAGADDGGSKAFFTSSDPGSARATEQGFQAGAAPAQTVAPTVAVERRAPRPHVASSRAARAPHVAVARHEAVHHTVTAEHRTAPHGTQHAMHRGSGADTTHS